MYTIKNMEQNTIYIEGGQSMKALKMILSMAAVALAVGAIACAITAYWDNLTEFVNAMKEKWIQKKKAVKLLMKKMRLQILQMCSNKFCNIGIVYRKSRRNISAAFRLLRSWVAGENVSGLCGKFGKE